MVVSSGRGRGGKKILKKRSAKRNEQFGVRRRLFRFCADKTRKIDYKDIKRLESFIRERGKVISPRGSGNCAKHQRMLARAIRKARFLALLPYVRM